MQEGDEAGGDGSAGAALPVCGRCGAVRRPDDPSALAWLHEREPTPGWLCVPCARTHLRAIEGRLRREWW